MANQPSTSTDRSAYARAAREAVAQATIVCRTVQARLDDLRAITKDDESPVTIADFASQAVVANVLRQHLGTSLVLVGEEGSASLRLSEHAPHLAAALEAARVAWPEVTEEQFLDAIDAGDAEPTGDHCYWTLDPIDGTKGFLRGEQYAVSLAYIDGNVPTLGVLGCPNLPMDFSQPFDHPDAHGAIYVASRNYGLYEVPADEPSMPLRKAPTLGHQPGDTVRMCESVESGHSRHEHSAQIMEKLGVATESFRLDSQAKYAVVARGQADVYLRMPTRPGYREKIWDHAAGALCASEGGAVVTDITGAPLDFSKGPTLSDNRGIVCASPQIHGRIIRAIDELGFAQMGMD